MKLYVGNLPYSTTDEELNTMFAEAGTVTSAQVVTDRYTHESRGFGFVEMASDEESLAAIKLLNGKEVGPRKLMVNEARPKEDNGGAPRSGGYQGGNGGAPRSGGYQGGNGGGSRY